MYCVTKFIKSQNTSISDKTSFVLKTNLTEIGNYFCM